MTASLRSAVLLVAALAGVGAAHLFHITAIENSTSYGLFVTALLGLGLYGSTYGIAIAEFRSQLRTLVVAVTLGVVAKAALVFGVMYWIFRQPDSVVLGIVVAQIDPLAVAAVRAKSRMSESAKALLAAWSSFDDPITVLFTVYVTVFVLGDRGGGVGAGLGSFGLNLLWNLLLAGAIYLGWLAARGVRRRHSDSRRGGEIRHELAVRALPLFAMVCVGAVAVWFSLLLALALIGMFFRPRLGRGLDRLIQAATVLATFAVGLAVVGGIEPTKALVLGGAAYVAQIVVGLLLTMPRRWRGDRARLALAQQNGMTAIVLALMLEPRFPGTIGIVAPAIVVVYVLHALCNGLLDRLDRPVPEPTRPVPEHQPTSPYRRSRPVNSVGNAVVPSVGPAEHLG
jgi:hypothetical protein